MQAIDYKCFFTLPGYPRRTGVRCGTDLAGPPVRQLTEYPGRPLLLSAATAQP